MRNNKIQINNGSLKKKLINNGVQLNLFTLWAAPNLSIEKGDLLKVFINTHNLT